MTDKEQILLVLRAQTGDKSAFNSLLESIQHSLYWYIYNTLSNKSHVNDILQEVFILIYRKLPGLNYPEYFKTWTFRIASREIFRFLRKKKNTFEELKDNEELEYYFPLENITPDNEKAVEKIFELVHFLPPASRAVICLHYKNQMPLNEIADVLEISVGTVKSRLSYGLKLLRKKVCDNEFFIEEFT